MISREELRQLAQVESAEECAISFYYQPQTPQDKSHREEAILIKDLVREALRRAERNGHTQSVREDLQRILLSAEGLHGNHSRGKAIFACHAQRLWREYDVPPRLGRSQITLGKRFHLTPLVSAWSGLPRTLVALADRKRARIFELRDDILIQKPDLEFGPLPKVGRSDGYGGYDAGHRERHIENEVKSHFKMFADSLQSLLNQEKHEFVLIGCRDEAWSEIEPNLHTDVKQRIAGRFLLDPIAASSDDVREYTMRILERRHAEEQQGLVREAVGQASRNGRGALGLRHVLTALERHEVQTLLVARGFKAQAVECTNCRHLDTRMVGSCAACGQSTRELSDVAESLFELALRNGADIEFLDAHPDLEKAGGVGALLRFRADQNVAGKVAV
jgi:peptide subunit release factor 1 (eRF1)